MVLCGVMLFYFVLFGFMYCYLVLCCVVLVVFGVILMLDLWHGVILFSHSVIVVPFG